MFYSAQTGGFYPADCTFTPDDAVEIDDAAYAALFAGQAVGKRIVAGDDGHPVLFDPQPVVTLDMTKLDLKTRIDAAAEIERLKYITPGTGQAMTYSQKSDEAARYLAAADPAAADYPLLNAEVGVTAASIGEVATVVNNAFRQWQVIGAAIEAARLGAKKSVNDAATADAAQAAYAALVWPTA